MYKLMFTGDLVTGFQRQEVIDRLSKLLDVSTDEVEDRFFTHSPVEFKAVEEEREAKHWRRQFADAGALLMVLPGDEDTPGGSRYAGADPANTQVEEPTMASITARLPAVRRRNRALMALGGIAAVLAVILIIGAWIFT